MLSSLSGISGAAEGMQNSISVRLRATAFGCALEGASRRAPCSKRLSKAAWRRAKNVCLGFLTTGQKRLDRRLGQAVSLAVRGSGQLISQERFMKILAGLVLVLACMAQA